MSDDPKNPAEQVSPPPAKPKPAPTLYLIVLGKLMEGSVLWLGAASFWFLARKNLPDLFDTFIRWLHLDPEGRFFNDISEWLETVTTGNVHTVALWMFLYGLFKMAGSVGLAFRARWAIWLAIGESAFFIPIEFYELIRRHLPTGEAHAHGVFAHPRIGIALVLIANIIIVWYLLKNRKRLFRHHR